MTTYVYPMPINRTFVQTRLGLLALAVLTLGLPAWSGADEDPTSGVPAQAFQQSDSAESTAAFAVTSSAVLTDYLDAALVNNPAVISARSRVQALEHVAGQAGALPDLKLSWGEMLVPVETRVGPQQRVLSISQKIPWFGKLGLQRAQADLQTEAAAESWRSSVQQVIGDVRTNWY